MATILLEIDGDGDEDSDGDGHGCSTEMETAFKKRWRLIESFLEFFG